MAGFVIDENARVVELPAFEPGSQPLLEGTKGLRFAITLRLPYMR